MRQLLVAFAFVALASPVFAQQGGPVAIKAIDTSTFATTDVGDNTNHAVRVNIVAGSAAGGTSSSYGSAFPATGTAVGFSDGANMQGARVVDLDTGAGTVYGLITNLVRRASGGPTEMIGQTTMALSLPVTLASDQSNVPTNQVQIGGVALSVGNGVSGTGVQRVAIASDNTAFQTRPTDGCGSTTFDPASLKIPDATLDVLTGTTTCVDTIAITNVTTAQATLTLQDTQGTPVQFANAIPVAPGGTVVFSNLGGLKFTSGIKYQASSANALSLWVKGRQ